MRRPTTTSTTTSTTTRTSTTRSAARATASSARTRRAVVEYVTRQLADEPDAIDVELQDRRGEITLLVHASPDDMGRLIGRRGRVIQALRQVTRAAGASEGVRATVDVAE